MALLFSNKVSPQFATIVINKSDELPIEPDWAMFIMNNESGLSSSIVNSIGCTGLIQFCPDVPGGNYKTIGGVRYLLSDIANMSPERQLDLVFQYWKDMQSAFGRFSSAADLYLATFYPVAIDKPDTYVMGIEKGSTYAQTLAKQNPSFDVNKDFQVTKGEFKKWFDAQVYKVVPTVFYDTFFKKKVSSSCTRRKLYFGQELRLAS